MDSSALTKFLLKQKPAAILLALKDSSITWYPSKLSQISKTSYVYVTAWLTTLEAEGWVKFDRKGRLKTVSLTEKGAAAASALDELIRKSAPTKLSKPVLPTVPTSPIKEKPTKK